MKENTLRIGQWSFLSSLFTLREKLKLFLLFSAQIVLSFLDLAGIAIFGLLGALAVNGVSYKEPGSRLLMVLRTLNLESFDFRLQAAILGVLATILLVARTVLAVYFTKKTLSFLGSKSARVSANLFQSVMQSDYQRIKGLTLNEWVAGLTKGINSLIIRVIGGLVTIVADLFLTLLILSGLFIYNFQIALMTVLMFSITGFSLYALVRNKAEQTGFLEQQTEIELNQRISESILAFREIHLSSDQDFYSRRIRDLRLKQVNSQTVSAFFPLLSKYVFEAILIVGTLLVGAVQFLLFDAVHAVASLSIFMVASTRIAPAVMRIQQSAVILKSSLGSSSISFGLLQEFSSTSDRILSDSPEAEQFFPTIELKKVEFRHSQNAEPLFSGFDLHIEKGSVVALVGPTGSGKSTLVDLILGVTKNDSGEVLISGQPARIAIRNWPRKVAYVPQKVAVFNTSVRENIALGSSINSTSDDEIWAALDRAELSDFVKSLPGMLDYKIFDQGLNLSGGQLQRIGIARALLTIPEILVFDEATSALDGQTEASISKTIQSLGSKVTVLIIAHRLSSIKDVSRIVYLNQGKILADGTFKEVREQVPSFDQQCSELGI
jgi:ABC-type multidrug transport system fused ATPase/permease subunit